MTATTTPFIIDAIRSPAGRTKAGGAFTELHPVDLLAQVLQHLMQRTGIDPAEVDDVITGCVGQAGEQAMTPGRVAWLAAGLPEHVPSTTIDRKCGSSQQAIAFGAQTIMAGVNQIVVACGIESMSRVPMGITRMGKDPFGQMYRARYGDQISQGIAAERVAAKWKLSREELDTYAAQSHQRAVEATERGQFAREIVPIRTADGVVDRDESIRAGTTVERLAQLKPAFEDPHMQQRFPEITDWRVTAGNASQTTDGASAVLLVSEAVAKRLNLKPRARLVAFDVRGDDPMMMLTAPITSSQAVLAKAGMKVQEMDANEVNEAFASVPLAWQRVLQADPARLNPSGGAIALGHPLGASGARLTTTLLNWLEMNNGRYGLQTMCEAGGMANSYILERV